MAMMTSPTKTGHCPRSPRSRSRSDHPPVCCSSTGTSATTAAVAPGTVPERSCWSPGVSMLISVPLLQYGNYCRMSKSTGYLIDRAKLSAGDGRHDLLWRRCRDVVRTYALPKAQNDDPVNHFEDVGQVV